MEKLFDDIERLDGKLANHIDDDYSFYNRTAIPEFVGIRNMLNDWFSRYPDTEKRELKSSFKAQFSSAFFELFVHELFIKQGFSLVVHPNVPNTTRRPDFLATKNGIEIYIEAKEATDESKSDKTLKNRAYTLYDSLNKMNCPNYFIIIDDLILKSGKQPNGKKINKYLEKEIAKVDQELMTITIDLQNYFDNKEIFYQDDDIELTIHLIPVSYEGQEQLRSTHLPIGIYPSTTFWGGSDESIKDAAKEKAGRYGNIDKPFLICINSTSSKGTTDYSVFEALLGSTQINWSTDSNNSEAERRKNGFFYSLNKPNYTRVSGIFVTSVHPSSSFVARHWLVKHPYTTNDLNFSLFDLSYYELQKNKLSEVKGKTIGEIIEKSLD